MRSANCLGCVDFKSERGRRASSSVSKTSSKSLANRSHGLRLEFAAPKSSEAKSLLSRNRRMCQHDLSFDKQLQTGKEKKSSD